MARRWILNKLCEKIFRKKTWMQKARIEKMKGCRKLQIC